MTELHLLSYLVQHPDKFRACREYLDGVPLENPLVKWTWDLLRGKFVQYDKFPTLDESKYLVEEASRTANNQQFAKDVSILLEGIYTNEVTGVSGEYLAKILIETEKVKLATSLQNATKLEDLKRFGERIADLEKCLSRERPTWMRPFATEVIKSPFEILHTYWGDPLSLGMPDLDGWLEGGLRRGELVTLIALTGVGKSLLMLWFCWVMAAMGHVVAYFSYDNVMGELLSRLWTSVTGISSRERANYTEEQYALQLRSSLYGVNPSGDLQDRFFIQKWGRNTKTVRDIEYVIDDIENVIQTPIDAVYVDYGDCVKNDNIRKDKRFELDEVFSALGALAEDRNKLVFTATQANRASKYLEVLDIDSAAEAWQKVWHSPIVMALCQNRLEKMQQISRLVIAKARRTYSDYVVPLCMSTEHMRVWRDLAKPIEYRAALEQAEIQAAAAEKQARRKTAQQGGQPLAGLPSADQTLLQTFQMIKTAKQMEANLALPGVGAMPPLVAC